MGKAFTEEEKKVIRERLMEEAIVQFRENGLKNASIRELTQAVGIAQGGFYSFFESKEALLVAVVNRRMEEKMQLLIQNLPETPDGIIGDPAGFISELLFSMGMQLKDKEVFNNIVSDSMKILLGDNENLEQNIVASARTALIALTAYWKKHGITVTVDTKGLRSLVKAAAVLFMNADIIGEAAFADIYHTFVQENTKRYITAEWAQVIVE